MANSDMLKQLALSKRKYFVYNVKFVCGLQKSPFQKDCDSILSRGIYSTEINILNYGPKEVAIAKAFTPVVVHNKAIAREPEINGPDNIERVVLKPFHATMDDCCKIVKMLKDADEQLKIGFLEIISPQPLEVCAVYTVTDIEQMHPSISVAQVEARSLSVS
ncbi:MAG: hypothetical protein JNN00_04555 [Chitinophagaceae bacterium]|nr:hypothetical protein [Chitinophagaceae bacterium]